MTQRHKASHASIFFITTNVLDGRKWFDQKTEAVTLFRIIQTACRLKRFIPLTFCILPNHFHLVVKPQPLQNGSLKYSISELMQSIKGTYSRQIHIGRFWQRRFFLRSVVTKKRLYQTIAYVQENYENAELSKEYAEEPYFFMHKTAIAEQLF